MRGRLLCRRHTAGTGLAKARGDHYLLLPNIKTKGIFMPTARRLAPALALAALLALALPAHAFLGGLLGSSPEELRAENGQITVNAAKLEKGQARHYSYREGDTLVRLFVVRDMQGTVRTALDACEQCRLEGKGYTLRDGAMLCVNCGQKFALNRIGLVKGGCNPHPFPHEMRGDVITINAKALLADGAPYFPGKRK